MSENKHTVADELWDMLSNAGVKRCYGIVGDALNPTIDALSRRSDIEFIHVRHEEWGAFAASADARIAQAPVAICGTAGPGVTHLLNGLLDAKHERSKVIVIAGDVETSLIDSEAIEEVSPYDLFRTASLYTGRCVNPSQARAVFAQAINTTMAKSGPTVISLPGDIAIAPAPNENRSYRPIEQKLGAVNSDSLEQVLELIDSSKNIAIFGGDGCRYCAEDVIAFAQKLQAPIGYSFKGKQWLEPDNPNAVGMTGLLGYGGCYDALHSADLVLLLGTDFPFPEFLPTIKETKIVQIDVNPVHIGRRVALTYGAVGDIGETVRALLPHVSQREDSAFLRKHVELMNKWRHKLDTYVRAQKENAAIRPEYLAHLVDELAADDAMLFVDTGTACIWSSRNIPARKNRVMMGTFSWASMANASPNAFGAKKAAPQRQAIALCGDGGFSMLGISDLITEVWQKTPVVHIIFNNSLLDFVNIEQQEAGLRNFGTDLWNPNYAKVAEAIGARGIRVEKPSELRAALTTAFAHTAGPVVVDVVVDKYALSVPAHIPGHTARGFTLSALKQVGHGFTEQIMGEISHNWRLINQML